MENVEDGKGAEGQAAPLTPAEVQKLLLDRDDVGLRERVLWRMLYETAARAPEMLALNVEGLDLANHCANVEHKSRATSRVEWHPDTGRLLLSLLKDRRTGPVFVSRYRRGSPGELGDRLSYRQAAEILKSATTDEQGRNITFHQLHRAALIRAAERGATLQRLLALSGLTSIRSLDRSIGLYLHQ